MFDPHNTPLRANLRLRTWVNAESPKAPLVGRANIVQHIDRTAEIICSASADRIEAVVGRVLWDKARVGMSGSWMSVNRADVRTRVEINVHQFVELTLREVANARNQL